MDRALTILLGTFAGASVEAFFFVVVLHLMLPETDGAYGQLPFSDPLVFPIMLIGAALASVLIYPFAFALLRSTDLRRAFLPLLVPGFAVISILFPFMGTRCAPFAVVATVAGMFIVRDRYPLVAVEPD